MITRAMRTSQSSSISLASWRRRDQKRRLTAMMQRAGSTVLVGMTAGACGLATEPMLKIFIAASRSKNQSLVRYLRFQVCHDKQLQS